MSDSERRKHRRQGPAARSTGIALTACEACRRKKTRCMPSESGDICKSCKAAGITCTFPAADGRRQRTYRDLLARIEELEQQLEAVSLAGGRSTSQQRSISEAPFPSTSSPGVNSQGPPASLECSTALQVRNTTAHIPESRLSGVKDNVSIRSVSDRLFIDAQGNIRAYGPLSDHVLATVSPGFNDELHGVDGSGSHETALPPIYPTSLPNRQRILAGAAAHIDTLPMGTDIRLVDHLLLAFFLWHHTIFPVLSCRIFLEHFCDGGKYCSPFLLNAILALGSRFLRDNAHDGMGKSANNPGELFFERAKQYLEDELQHPTVVTVQGLALMAEREAFAGRTIRAGLYSAMCGRLVSELGLYLDTTPLVLQSVITMEDNYLRARTFWGVWAADKQLSSILGQPCSIRLPHIACRYPAYWDQEDFDWWLSLDSSRLVPAEGFTNQTGCLHISERVRDMGLIYLHGMEHIYWRANTRDGSSDQAYEVLEINMQRTRQAMQDLPALENQLRGKTLPGLLMIYLIYHHHIIMMNRPFIAERASGHPDDQSEDSPRARCRSSASSIVRLVSLFRDATPYGLRGTLNNIQHGIILAAGVLIVEMRLFHSANDKQAVLSDLLQTLDFLEDLSAYRPAAAKALLHLRTLAVSHNQAQASLPRFTGEAPLEVTHDALHKVATASEVSFAHGCDPAEFAGPSKLPDEIDASFFDALQDPDSSFWQSQGVLATSTDMFGLGLAQEPALSQL